MSGIHAAQLTELPSLELTLSPGSITLGRAGAGSWVERHASDMISDLSFGFTGCASPPSTIVELQAAFARSAATQRPLPVPASSEQPALMGLSSDLQLAFWRSVVRFRRGLDFGLRDDLLIDLEILDRASFDNVSVRSRAVLYATLVGQTLCRAVNGKGPLDARRYVTEVLTYGVTDAILLEHERDNTG